MINRISPVWLTSALIKCCFSFSAHMDAAPDFSQGLRL